MTFCISRFHSSAAAASPRSKTSRRTGSLICPLNRSKRSVSKETWYPCSAIASTQAYACASLLSTNVPSTSKMTPRTYVIVLPHSLVHFPILKSHYRDSTSWREQRDIPGARIRELAAHGMRNEMTASEQKKRGTFFRPDNRPKGVGGEKGEM